jgi:hypothetical protein
VKLYDNGLFIAQTTADGSGNWSIQLTSANALKSDSMHRTHAITVIASDLAGNTATSSALNVAVYANGDIDSSGHLNTSDIDELETALSDEDAYRAAHNYTLQDWLLVADVNRDGYVDNADLQAMSIFIANYGGY